MKKTILGLSLFISSLAVAQNGLEQIIVEKYYIANAADAAQTATETNPGSKLLPGSITYRIYADMAPGYRLIMVYADNQNAHNLIFKTSTYFYNNPNGDISVSGVKAGIKNNLLALDSYLTLGTVAKDNYGILKADDDGLLNNITSDTGSNPNGILLNTTTEMGVPLTTNDGMIAGTGAINTPSIAGIDADLGPISDGSNAADSIGCTDGSIYASAGAKGPVPTDNRVLIAQLTTNGELGFELNILVQGGPDDIGQFFVANNPGTDVNGNPEITIPTLTYPNDVTAIETYTHKDYNEVLFSVYPNPAQDHVNIEVATAPANSKGSYTIFGVIGNVIAHKELNGINSNYKEAIDISSFAKGLYTIQLNVNGVVSTKKIIKN